MKKLLLTLPLLGILASCEKSPYPANKANLSGRVYQRKFTLRNTLYLDIHFDAGQVGYLREILVEPNNDTTSDRIIDYYSYSNFVDSNLIILQPLNAPKGYEQLTFALEGNKLIQKSGDIYFPQAGDTYTRTK